MVGLAIDISHFWLVRSQLQNAADAAALAGAKDLNGTSAGRTRALTQATVFARDHFVDGIAVSEDEIVSKETGRWSLSARTFTTAGVDETGANAIRVTIRRQNVPSFFEPLLSAAAASQTLAASAIAVAGGAGKVPCAAPFALANCALSYDGSGNLNCPTELSFQNGMTSIGLTHPDGTSPVNGNNTAPYIAEVVDDPGDCDQGASVGDELSLQNGNDLKKSSVDDINNATNDGVDPLPLVLPVIDLACGGGGPTYNQTARVVGFIKMTLVGARWTSNAPAEVATACPTLGKKNICVASDCSLIDGATAGGTIQTSGLKVYLVD